MTNVEEFGFETKLYSVEPFLNYETIAEFYWHYDRDVVKIDR